MILDELLTGVRYPFIGHNATDSYRLVRVGVERGGDVRGGHEALLARVLAPHARPAVARVRLQHEQPLAALHAHG